MLADNWDVRPGDWVETSEGIRGMVTSTCTTKYHTLICVEVGFKWVPMEALISWTPGS